MGIVINKVLDVQAKRSCVFKSIKNTVNYSRINKIDCTTQVVDVSLTEIWSFSLSKKCFCFEA